MGKGETQGSETQTKESLTINEVLDAVYDAIVVGFDSRKVVRSFNDEFCEWDSFDDINGTRGIYFRLSGVLFEIEPNRGILIVRSNERKTSWYSSLIKMVAWIKLETGKEIEHKIFAQDYPSWDEVPLITLIFELPKGIRDRSVRMGYGGLLVNQGQRLALNGVIPMQPEFVAQKEAVSQDVVRGPGGALVLLDKSIRETDEMYADDLVTSGTSYKPQVVPYLVEQIRKDLIK